jgi:hypothetical protein
MATRTFGSWAFTSDRDATVAAYARAPRGGSDECGCNGCRNFAAARDAVYPPAFLSFLQSVGIDFRKDGEVHQFARLGPRRHCYGGWFHFVGVLERTGDFPVVPMSGDFDVWLTGKGTPPLDSLRGHPLVVVEFHATAVPWVLDEPEAE